MNASDRTVDSYGRCCIEDNGCRSSRPGREYATPARTAPAQAPSLLADPLPFAGFAPGEHRQLLADINRWRRTNGWNWGDTHGLVNGRFTSEATTAVDWAPADDKPQGLSIARRDSASRRWSSPDFYPADSIRETVDMLAAIGILPPQFSSQYKAGWHDGFFHTVEDETRAEIKASWLGTR